MPRPPERPADRFIRSLVRLVLKVFFRQVEVVGAERIPADRPLVLVANHVNGLVDPILIVGPLPIMPRFLAKSTLWKNPLIRPFLELAQAIPVYRRQDEGVDASRNAETFARGHDLLASGGALALFPEGKSHNEPSLQPLKTGAARIVLEAETKHPGLGTRIVPIGLHFDAKESFRSRALVQVGEPLDPSPDLSLYIEDGPAAVRALTARIDDALQDVTVNFATWEEARLIARAADLYGRPTLEMPKGRRMSETVNRHRAFIERYQDLQARFPERVAAVAESVRVYDRLLSAFRLRDSQVAAAYPPSPVIGFVVRTTLRLLVHLPLAAVGTVLNIVPYGLLKLLVPPIAQTSDQMATYKVFGALFLYPLIWIAEAVLAARFLDSWPAGLLVLVAGPLTGYAALLFHEQRALFWREARAYLVLRTQKRLAGELRERRGAVVKGVEELAGLSEGREGDPPT